MVVLLCSWCWWLAPGGHCGLHHGLLHHGLHLWLLWQHVLEVFLQLLQHVLSLPCMPGRQLQLLLHVGLLLLGQQLLLPLLLLQPSVWHLNSCPWLLLRLPHWHVHLLQSKGCSLVQHKLLGFPLSLSQCVHISWQ